MNSNNTTSIEELENNFFEKKCQLIEKAGDNQLVIVNFVDIEDLISEAYTQGVTDTIERVEEEVIEPGIKHGTLPYPNPYGETVKVKRHNQVMQEVKNIQLTKLSSMKEKGMK